jgi:hypothetical protein
MAKAAEKSPLDLISAKLPSKVVFRNVSREGRLEDGARPHGALFGHRADFD